MTRATGYVRLSSHRGERDPSTSPERQRDAITGYCQAKGWKLTGFVEDLDVSGSAAGLRLDRPGLKRVRERYHATDALVVAKLDRLARNVSDFMAIVEEAATHGVAVVSVAESLDLTTPGGRFTAQILAAFAEMEAATIRARIMESIARLRRDGRWTGGPNAPYGYVSAPHPDGRGRTLAVEPREAGVVREIARRVLDGETVYAITRDLNTRRVPSKTGRAWTVQSVRQIVTGTAVRGYVKHRGELVRGEDGQPLQAFPEILDAETWHACRSHLLRPGRQARGRAASHLLTGIVVCADCGGRMYVGTAGGGLSYRCTNRARGRVECAGPSIRADALDGWVESLILGRYADATVYDVVRTEHGEPGALADVQTAIDDLARQIAATDEDAATLLEQLAALKERRRQLRSAGTRVSEDYRRAGALGDLWRRADVAERNTLARLVIAAIRVGPGKAGSRKFNPDRVQITWRAADDWAPLGAEVGHVIVRD